MNANQFTVDRINHQVHEFKRYYAEERLPLGITTALTEAERSFQ